MLEYNNHIITNACIVNTLIAYFLYIQTIKLYSKVRRLLYVVHIEEHNEKHEEHRNRGKGFEKISESIWANF